MTSDDQAVLSEIKKRRWAVSPQQVARVIRNMNTAQVTKSCEYLCHAGLLERVKGKVSMKYKMRLILFNVKEYLELHNPCTRRELYDAAEEYKCNRVNVNQRVRRLKKSEKVKEVDGLLHYDSDPIDVKVLFNNLLSGVRNK